jgi:hypothetical protein
MPLYRSRRCLLFAWLEDATFLSNAGGNAAALRSSAASARLTTIVRVPPFLHVVAFTRRGAVARLIAAADVSFPEPFRPSLRPLPDQKYRSRETDRHDGEPCHGTFSQFIQLYNTQLYYTNQLWRLMVAGRGGFARCGHLVLPFGGCIHARKNVRSPVQAGRPNVYLLSGRLWAWGAGAPLHGVEHCMAWSTRGTVVWLTMQSDANPSQHSNSLIAGELNREFLISGPFFAILTSNQSANSMACD